jgi:hypothetical protein
MPQAPRPRLELSHEWFAIVRWESHGHGIVGCLYNITTYQYCTLVYK